MAIELDKVSYIYHINTPFASTALHEISLTIFEGETLGITGDIGSGKSTLLQLTGGLIKPSGGRVLKDGRDLARLSKRELSALHRRVGLVFQHPETQIFAYQVFDEIAFGPRNAGLKPAAVTERVKWALRAVGLPDGFQNRHTAALSAGEQRRVAIAGVLASKPAWILLDEPTAGLDGEGISQVMATLSAFGQQPGQTVVMVSHDLRQLLAISDRIVWLKAGKVWLDLRREEIIDHYQILHESAILPEVLNVMHALNEKGWQLDPAALTPSTLATAIAEHLRGEKQPCKD